jgi:hypothetical protein
VNPQWLGRWSHLRWRQLRSRECWTNVSLW